LFWIGNWYAAGPLYAKAENLFHAAGDTRNEIYARVGRIRAQATVVPLDETLFLLSEQLREPVVNEDAQLRLWCLALRGYAELDFDTASARRDWSEALQIASRLHETQWEARAQGELGIIAFLDGNTASAVSLVGKAILSSYKTGDIGYAFLDLAVCRAVRLPHPKPDGRFKVAGGQKTTAPEAGHFARAVVESGGVRFRTLRLDAFRERVDRIADLGTDRPQMEMYSRRQHHGRGKILPR
jgi:hypothetical protein